MKKEERLKTKKELEREIRTACFRIMEALAPEESGDSYVKLVRAVILKSNKGLVRLYGFSHGGYLLNGFTVEAYRDNIIFKKVKEIKTKKKEGIGKRNTFYYVIRSSLNYILKRYKGVQYEVFGEKYLRGSLNLKNLTSEVESHPTT